MDVIELPTATAMERAAVELLASLDTEQRERISYQFSEETQRRSWFYTPTDHGGLPLPDISPLDQQLLFRLLAAGLSAGGYATATLIMGAQSILDRLERWLAPCASKVRTDRCLQSVVVSHSHTVDVNEVRRRMRGV